MPIDKSALEIESGAELVQFDLGTVRINDTDYEVLTGYEGTGKCFWCGGYLKGKLKRYCYGHMAEYYRHFFWGSASQWALEKAEHKCQNCGKEEGRLNSYTDRTNLEVHHIVPLNGGSRTFSAFNLPWNLVVLCHECHVEIHKHPKVIRDSWVNAKQKGQEVMELKV